MPKKVKAKIMKAPGQDTNKKKPAVGLPKGGMFGGRVKKPGGRIKFK